MSTMQNGELSNLWGIQKTGKEEKVELILKRYVYELKNDGIKCYHK